LYFVMPPVPFTEGVFVLTATLGTTTPRTGTSQKIRVIDEPTPEPTTP